MSMSMHTILWSTQGGRAKACARRTTRILRDANHDTGTDTDNPIPDGYYGSSFDDYGARHFLKLGETASADKDGNDNDSNNDNDNDNDRVRVVSTPIDKRKLVILFVSTTGDAEQCDSIHETWKILLQRSLPHSQLSNVSFALFCLGDRAYGPQAFCAAGRKLAARMVQLGATPFCNIGYGDDGTPNGGVFADLDVWLENEFLPRIVGTVAQNGNIGGSSISISGNSSGDGDGDGSFARTGTRLPQSPYLVQVGKKNHAIAENGKKVKEWQMKEYQESYDDFFASQCPATAYHYNSANGDGEMGQGQGHRILHSQDASTEMDPRHGRPLFASIVSNERITATDWMQDTRHISIHVETKASSSQKTTNGKGNGNTCSKNGTHTTEELNTPSSSIPKPIPIPTPLPYQAGDIATIMPSNRKSIVDRFLSCLPSSIQSIANDPLHISTNIASTTQYHSAFTPWPTHATLRGILTHCADIGNLPEREDLRALSVFCNPSHPVGIDQKTKLVSLSETHDAALYGDYILREKRNWGDVLFDFDSIKFESSTSAGASTSASTGASTGASGKITNEMPFRTATADKLQTSFVPLTVEYLLMILAPIMPRHFSIASAPSSPSSTDLNLNLKEQGSSGMIGYSMRHGKYGFNLDLCVAVVEGETRRGRKYAGLCSKYLSSLKPSGSSNGSGRGTSTCNIRIWIRPGSFGKLPLDLNNDGRFCSPIMVVGAGTGVAPLRGLLHEREAIQRGLRQTSARAEQSKDENILVFGCRKSNSDYYYKEEWKSMEIADGYSLRVLTAFSQEQKHKMYVQRKLREADEGLLIAKHILENNGAVYIAGGAKMARAVKDEIVECLGKLLPTGENGARSLLQKLQRKGKFSVEAWS